MKRNRLSTCFLIVLAIGLLAGCAAQTPPATLVFTVAPTYTPVPPTPTLVPPTATPAVPALVIAGLDGFWSLTLDELMALPITEGQGGIKSSTGKITVPELYTGVSLKDLVATLGTFDESMGVNVPKIAPVLVYERFQGFGLTAAQPVAAILILAALAAFGLLRLVLQRQE